MKFGVIIYLVWIPHSYCGVRVRISLAPYSFRLIILVFHGRPNMDLKKYTKVKENSIIIIFPMIILSLFAISSGYIFKDYFVGKSFINFWINSGIFVDLR